METEDRFFIKRIEDLAEQSWKNNQYTFTDFLNPSKQALFYQTLPTLGDVEYELSGGVEGCERQVLRFGGEASLGYVEDFPVCCILVRPALAKFADQLTHRDYLGALMNLGIERDTIGDIMQKEKEGYIFCLNKVADYIVEHLTQVKHTTIRCQLLEEIPEAVQPQKKEVTLIVSSMRMDGVVSKLYHMSRSQSLNLFREKKVFVNGRQMENNSGILKDGDVVSVRGFGKFVYEGCSGQTKKGNYSVLLGVYQ